MTYEELKTGVHHKIPGDEVIEFACPRCYYVWLEYGSSGSYPDFCPGCGHSIEHDDWIPAPPADGTA